MGLATCAELPGLSPDDALLLPALAALGIDAAPLVWDDPSIAWDSYDLVVVRSTWDYTRRRREFLGWAAGVPQIANPMRVLVWNTDKTYLRDLAAAGVPVVPTTFVAPGEPYEPAVGEVVVKPTVSAGARDTARRTDGGAGAVAALHATGRTAMVQPYLAAVEGAGETSVLFLGGELSHAVRRPALLPTGGGPAPADQDAGITARAPSAAELLVATAAVGAVRHDLLYARVDLVPGADGEPLVLELELTEPTLFLRHEPAAASRLARAVARRLAGPPR